MTKKDIRKNYLNIQGWMVQDLELKGNELLAYALIFGFCQDNDSEFTGSISYICTWLNCSKNTALSCIKSLIKKGLITKDIQKKNNLTFNHYKVNFDKINQNCTGGAKIARGVQKTNLGGAKIEPQGGAKIEPNNIYNNKDNNTDIRACKYPSFIEFREYAITTAYEKLNIKLDETKLKSKYLSWSENNWINGNGKKIKNWKTTLLNSLPYLKNDNNNQTDAQKRMNSTPVEHQKWTY